VKGTLAVIEHIVPKGSKGAIRAIFAIRDERRQCVAAVDGSLRGIKNHRTISHMTSTKMAL